MIHESVEHGSVAAIFDGDAGDGAAVVRECYVEVSVLGVHGKDVGRGWGVW